MKIAFVCDAVYPFSKGGREKRLYDLSQALVREGHTVDIYSMKWWEGPNEISQGKVELHALCRNHSLYVGKHRSIKQALLFGLACFKLIKVSFDVVDVDQIPFFPIYSMWLVCFIKRKHLFVTWHEVWDKEYLEKYFKKFVFVANIIEKISAHLPTYIAAVSLTTANDLSSVLHRARRVIVIPNGVDFNAIRAVPAAKIKQDVIFAARLIDHKHAELLVHSIIELKLKYPKIRCLIIGTGPEEIPLKQLVSFMNLENHVRFHDFYENINNLYAAIKASKVYVLPSEREGFGIGLLEANACGVPAVTFNLPHNAASKLIKKDKNGSLAEQNPLSLALSIERWLDTVPMDVQKAVEQYDLKTMVKKLEELYTR